MGLLLQGEHQLHGQPSQPSTTLSVMCMLDYSSRDHVGAMLRRLMHAWGSLPDMRIEFARTVIA
jgi:hypothetical protein